MITQPPDRTAGRGARMPTLAALSNYGKPPGGSRLSVRAIVLVLLAALTVVAGGGALLAGPTTIGPEPRILLTSATPASLTGSAKLTELKPPKPKVTLNPQKVPAGQQVQVTVRGDGFSACAPADDPDGVIPGSPILLSWTLATELPQAPPPSRKGTFERTITVPADATPGSHTIRASCKKGGDGAPISDSVKLIVREPPKPTKPPEITLSPDRVSAGAQVTVSGRGFAACVPPGEPGTQNGTLTVASDTVTNVPPVLIGSTGAFQTAITVPANTTPGSHTITASCKKGGDGAPITDSAKLIVLEPPPEPGGGGSTGGGSTGGGSTGGGQTGDGFTGVALVALVLSLLGLLLTRLGFRNRLPSGPHVVAVAGPVGRPVLRRVGGRTVALRVVPHGDPGVQEHQEIGR